MADEQHTPDDASHDEDEAPQKRGGLGRFASRFRRGERASIEESGPRNAGDEDVAAFSAGADHPPTLAPELDLSVTPRPAQLVQPQQVPEPQAEQPAAPEPPDESHAELELPDTSPALDPTTLAAPELDAEQAAETPAEPTPAPSAWATTDEAPSPEAAEPPTEPEPVAPPPVAASEAPTEPPPMLPLPEEPTEPNPVLAPVLAAEPAEESRSTRIRPSGISAHLVVTSALATMVMLAFLLIEPSPRWLLLLGAAAVVFGLDGTLRQTWREPFSLGQETAPFLFVPALYVMAVPVLIEHNISGELVLLVGLGAGLGFGALAWAEVGSVRPMAEEYDQARLVVTANTYLTGFAVFSLTYVFELTLPAAILATAITAAMLAVEVLREGEIDPLETLGLSLVAGFILGEMRWLLYYVPLDTYLAGLTLLLAFYLATGLLHSHVIRALNRVVAAEYSGIAAAGLALVILARAAGLA